MEGEASGSVGGQAGLLAGVRIVECAILEPDQMGLALAELGADVIKVEAPGGDYIRKEAWPFAEGVSILHWHCNRSKRSIVVDLRTPEGVEVFLDLVRESDAVLEGMRPGALARRGITFERMQEVNPAIVFGALSGWGGTGPYRSLPSHGIGFDAWSGVAPAAVDEDGFAYMPNHTTIGTRAGAVWGALAVTAAILRARTTGRGAWVEVAESDASAFTNWLRIEGLRAHERPEDEVTGNPSDNGERREPGVEGMRASIRYQYYRTADGHVLFMASERAFWENFCRGVGREDLYQNRPGGTFGDHAVGDNVLRAELQSIFDTKTTDEWVDFGVAQNVPICPVHDSQSIMKDRQFLDRFPWLPASEFGADMMPIPVHMVGEEGARAFRAPVPGEHTEEILREVLGYDDARIDGLGGAVATAE